MLLLLLLNVHHIIVIIYLPRLRSNKVQSMETVGPDSEPTLELL